MKRRDLIRHLERQGCQCDREGSKHTRYKNPAKNKTSSIPRHSEINNLLARKICRDLGIPEPGAPSK
ncbi:MAG: type II toxin-antitoxin system HicA family toxin [Terriglobia bacterium]